MNAHLPSLGDEKLRTYLLSRATMADTFINRNTVLCVFEEVFHETELASIKNHAKETSSNGVRRSRRASRGS